MRKRKMFRSIRWVAASVLLVSALALQAVVLAVPEAAQAAGTGWYAQDPGTSGLNFRDISVVDANTVWAAAEAGWVVKSTDGGSTWVRKTGLPGG